MSDKMYTYPGPDACCDDHLWTGPVLTNAKFSDAIACDSPTFTILPHSSHAFTRSLMTALPPYFQLASVSELSTSPTLAIISFPDFLWNLHEVMERGCIYFLF